ncbi:MAG: hypothetical protein V2I33_25400 [Kangiellaceae bacterium]|jgi:hypothetical protein|nr:hypothetical protein [Kangiellaceae bacterium]
MATKILLSFLVVVFASAWGPPTHYYFTCNAIGGGNNCVTNGQHEYLLKGTELPDAFYFAEWLAYAPKPCPNELRVLHDMTFAGY